VGKPFRIGAGSRPDSHGPEKDAEALDFHDLSSPSDPAATIRIEHAGDHLDVIADPEGTPVKIGEIPGGGGGGGGSGTIYCTFDANPGELESRMSEPITIPFNWTITGWRIVAVYGTSAGTATFDVLRQTSLGGTPASIVGTVPPEITGANFAQGSDMTGWTTTGDSGQLLIFVLQSPQAFRSIRIELLVTKS
jgi:hypothetical protein